VAKKMMAQGRPKVLHIITRLLRGGAEEKTLRVVYGLKDRYDFHLGYGAEFEDAQVGKLRDSGIKTRRFSLLRHYDPFSIFFSVFQMYRYMRRNHFQIVHTHSTEAGVAGRIAAYLAGVPIIIHTIHGIPFIEGRTPYLRIFLLFWERTMSKVTTKFESNADIITKKFLEKGVGKDDQYITIYSGVDIEKCRDSQLLNLNIPSDHFKVLMASRLAKGKGFEELIAAAKKILRQKEKIAFIIAGEGKLEQKIETSIYDNGLQDHFVMLGYREDLHRVMKSADLFVLPSHAEGTPRAIAEAMAAGLPVIATSVGGVSEQVDDGKTGLLIEPKNPDQLAEAILRLLNDRELRLGMGREGYKKVQSFSLNRMLKDVDALYKGLLRSELPGRLEEAG